MFPGVGTIINIITIISGASLGVLVGNRMPTRTRTLLTDVLGLVTLLGAASALIPLWSDRYNSALPQGWSLLVVLGSLLIGGLIGSALKLENKLDSLGENLRVRFKASSESNFVEGFVAASLHHLWLGSWAARWIDDRDSQQVRSSHWSRPLGH